MTDQKLLKAIDTHEASRLEGRRQAFEEVLGILDEVESAPDIDMGLDRGFMLALVMIRQAVEERIPAAVVDDE